MPFSARVLLSSTLLVVASSIQRNGFPASVVLWVAFYVNANILRVVYCDCTGSLLLW
jgi:hypothetical protein